MNNNLKFAAVKQLEKYIWNRFLLS